jgi:hypothetical protein
MPATKGGTMARIKVWREPEWGSEFAQFAPRWSVDDGYRTTVADSWAHAMSIARRWAGIT